MLRYLYANQLNQYPKLASAMFRDRADQFGTRLGWPVEVDHRGEERDCYDRLDPLYVIWERPDGGHGGSMRFLPTTGRTMVNEHFLSLAGGVEIRSSRIWECTRFCLSRGAGSHIAGALMAGGSELMLNFGLTHFVGVFDARMVRIYRLLGSSPEVVGTSGSGRDAISVGLWSYEEESRDRVLARAGLSGSVSKAWFETSFLHREAHPSFQWPQPSDRA